MRKKGEKGKTKLIMNASASDKGVDQPAEHRGLLSGFLKVGEGEVTKNVTLIVLLSYVALVGVFTTITGMGGSSEEKWLELTKTGFTTLGSALTLILGYYFGQKQVSEEVKKQVTQQLNEEKEKKVKEVQEEARKKLEQLVAKVSELPTPPQTEKDRTYMQNPELKSKSE